MPTTRVIGISLLLLAVALGGCVAASPEELAMEQQPNRSGCNGLPSCGAIGRCCDTHDACVDQHCPSPYGNVLVCDQAARDSGACPAACAACHDTASTCIAGCGLFGGADCGPADCCGGPGDDDDTCGEEQACYDRTKTPPELITDPCECEARGIPLSQQPPRPRDHCCEETGYGCCAEDGGDCSQGSGQPCCTGLMCEAGVCSPDGTGDYCGDGTCGAKESTYICPADCPPES